MAVLSSTNVTRHGVDRLRGGLPECRVVWEPTATLATALSLGRLHWHRKQWHEAEAAFSEAIRLDPANAEAYHRRAGCRVNTKRVADSLPDFDAAVRLDPKNPEVVKNRGIAHLNLLRFDDAIADLKHALDLGPSDPQPYRKVLGQACAQRAVESGEEKKWSEAVADMDEAIQFDPSNAGYFDRRGSLKFNQRQFAGAAADFTEAILLEPAQPAYYLHRGYAHEAPGKKDEAAEDYRRRSRVSDGWATPISVARCTVCNPEFARRFARKICPQEGAI